ncbi:hypothetical protein AAFF_G00306970 [Aldrovandia affinis]|uniref:Uncharacterized protein n=1 Tax=Aldrovandia affinis TaxID=143900 RepID=A0AAD7W102_9TELE|nr:hypothetical protein AAFF_G00306970 [Aldrovandia affinis]
MSVLHSPGAEVCSVSRMPHFRSKGLDEEQRGPGADSAAEAPRPDPRTMQRDTEAGSYTHERRVPPVTGPLWSFRWGSPPIALRSFWKRLH